MASDDLHRNDWARLCDPLLIMVNCWEAAEQWVLRHQGQDGRVSPSWEDFWRDYPDDVDRALSIAHDQTGESYEDLEASFQHAVDWYLRRFTEAVNAGTRRRAANGDVAVLPGPAGAGATVGANHPPGPEDTSISRALFQSGTLGQHDLPGTGPPPPSAAGAGAGPPPAAATGGFGTGDFRSGRPGGFRSGHPGGPGDRFTSSRADTPRAGAGVGSDLNQFGNQMGCDQYGRPPPSAAGAGGRGGIRRPPLTVNTTEAGADAGASADPNQLGQPYRMPPSPHASTPGRRLLIPPGDARRTPYHHHHHQHHDQFGRGQPLNPYRSDQPGQDPYWSDQPGDNQMVPFAPQPRQMVTPRETDPPPTPTIVGNNHNITMNIQYNTAPSTPARAEAATFTDSGERRVTERLASHLTSAVSNALDGIGNDQEQMQQTLESIQQGQAETGQALGSVLQGQADLRDGQADLRKGQTLLGQGVHAIARNQTSMERDQQLDRQLQEKRHQDMLKDQVGAKYDRLHLKQVQDATLENAKCANANSEIAVTQIAGLIMGQQRSAADNAAALYTGTDAKVPTGAAASHPLGDLTDTWQPGHTGTTLAPPQDTGRSGLLQQDEGVDDELQEFLRLCLNDENEDEGVAGSSVGVPGPSQHAVSGEEEKKEEDDEALSQDPTAFGGEEEEKQEVDLGGEEEEKEEVDGVAGVEDELRGLSLDGVGRRGVVQGSGVMDLTTTGDEGDDNGAEEGDGGGTEGNSVRPVNNRRTGKVFAPERETAMKIDEENRKAKAAAEAAEQDQDAEANATVSDAPPASRTRSQQQRNMTVAGEKVDAAEDDATEDDAEDDAEDDTEDEIENEIENQNENENEIENQNNDRIDLLSYQQLRRACRELGLGGNGTKPELRARLRRAGFRAP